MKFKYYLRGAGIGVIVSTVILSVAFLFHDNMSDAEVIQRAMELGMVMEEGTKGTLADLPHQGNTKVDPEQAKDGQQVDTRTDDGQGSTTDEDTSVDQSEPANPDQTQPDTQGDAAKQDPSNANQPNDVSKPEDKTNDPTEPKPEDKADDPQEDQQSSEQGEEDARGRKVTITIVGGDVSRMVSQKVQEAGLVDDAEEFNDYLGTHNYANFLQPGSYEIRKGASFRQIAEILTNQ